MSRFYESYCAKISSISAIFVAISYGAYASVLLSMILSIALAASDSIYPSSGVLRTILSKTACKCVIAVFY